MKISNIFLARSRFETKISNFQRFFDTSAASLVALIVKWEFVKNIRARQRLGKKNRKFNFSFVFFLEIGIY